MVEHDIFGLGAWVTVIGRHCTYDAAFLGPWRHGYSYPPLPHRIDCFFPFSFVLCLYRALQSDAAAGGVSPRILSQPSSPCFSATSHSSSACTSPGGTRIHREGRGGHRGPPGYGGAHVQQLRAPPPGFADGGVAVDGGGLPVLSLRLSGDGSEGRLSRLIGDGGGGGNSGFASAPAGGNVMLGFPSGSSSSSLHEIGGVGGGRGVFGGGVSRSNGASPRMESMDINTPQSLAGMSSRVLRSSFESAGRGGVVAVGGGGGSGGVAPQTSGIGSMAHPSSMPSLAGRRDAGMSLSLSPPGCDVGGADVVGLDGGGVVSEGAAGVRAGVARRSSYEERGPAQWSDGGGSSGLSHFAGGTGGGGGGGRLGDLSVSRAHRDQPQGSSDLPVGGAGGSGATWARAGAVDPPSAAPRSSAKAAIPMMCAEFALLTPKRALSQQRQWATGQAVGGGVDGAGVGPSVLQEQTDGVPSGGGIHVEGVVGARRARGGSINSSSAGSGVALGSQVRRANVVY